VAGQDSSAGQARRAVPALIRRPASMPGHRGARVLCRGIGSGRAHVGGRAHRARGHAGSKSAAARGRQKGSTQAGATGAHQATAEDIQETTGRHRPRGRPTAGTVPAITRGGQGAGGLSQAWRIASSERACPCSRADARAPAGVLASGSAGILRGLGARAGPLAPAGWRGTKWPRSRRGTAGRS
jgi:hypothetical protein